MRAKPNLYNNGWRLWEYDRVIGPNFSSFEEASLWALANGYKIEPRYGDYNG